MSAKPTKKPLRPSFAPERAALARHTARRAAPMRAMGLDEVGRGPLAGPVVAAAAVLSETAGRALAARGLTDSKALTAARRAALADDIAAFAKEGAAQTALGAASVAEIEALNIHHATHLAMRRAARRLLAKLDAAGAPRPLVALVDGRHAPDGLGAPTEALVKGDAKSLSIAAAAVIAKVARDRAMAALGARYPDYGWERNAGYATAAHRAAAIRLGLTRHHRPLFCRAIAAERAAAEV